MGSMSSSGQIRESMMAGMVSSSLSCFTKSSIFIFFIAFMKRMAASMKAMAACRYLRKNDRKTYRYLASETSSRMSMLSSDFLLEMREDR